MKHINLCSYCGKHNPSTGVKKDSPGSKRDPPGSKKDASNVPYKCHHCDKYFPQKQNLKRHIQTHFNTTTESFSCETCDTRFFRKDNMIRLDWIRLDQTIHIFLQVLDK